ncbi:LRR receptor-like serine/threonine-protein kinase RGI5 [Malania oleifera]|uniref:LRR receptor-like serine/threonine-protein kinase RGI5 n=1 Tax=Malania oleifera TaxID=397392 RepID=UPI0025AE12C0|nr:LRR receptor-like serine/threonine-protein kinase RGI5 [Malania oleifera]
MSRFVDGASVNLFFFFLCLVLPSGFSQPSTAQKGTMLKLFELLQNNTASSPWSNLTKDTDPCWWKGVSCSSPNNQSIIGLSLSGFFLSNANILPIICEIESLQTLNLSNNLLSSIPDGFITGCGGIKGLKLLNFSRNRLSGNLPTFHGFDGLEVLDLCRNDFNGAIDLQLDGLVGLKSLNLSYNHFTGPIPTHLGKAMVLEQLELSTNFFVGRIPEEIVDYRNLTVIDLNFNNLSGSVPNRIGELSKLEILFLSSTSLSGEIPKSLSSITTLSRFAANQNKFNGTIPAGLTRFLKNLDLSYNKLSGSIPSDLFSSSDLQTVDLSNNLLEGPIPDILSPNLVRLRLGNNSLSGTIPSATLESLQKLMYLELGDNNLNGSIPSGLGLCRNLALLDLAKNNLTGAVPADLGNLSNLQVMNLQFNKLEGRIPVQITQIQSLLVLNMSWNSLRGSIPPSISSLQKLTNLNLQGNKLSGSIPNSIQSLNFLLELQLGNNQLSGKIPPMPGTLQIALNLSSNFFEGRIPNTLSQLTALEVLDLSNNSFSGDIPDFLTKMRSLIQLILSNNQLSGEVPKFGSWVTVVYRSGNKDLADPTTPTHTMPQKKRKSVVVAVTIAVASAALAVGVITFLVLAITRRFYGVNDKQIQSREDFSHEQVIQCNLLTAHSIHRSNIDFAKAMRAVSSPSNIVHKTRFSTYFKAIMPSGMTYFVKKLNWSDKIFQLGSHERFAQELQVLGKLSNSNVMTPLAYVLTVESAYLFYEFAQKGTLFDVLHGSSRNDFDWASRYGIALGIAQGVASLHGCTPGPVLLLDLSSKTILLKSLKEPQIGDIELHKVIDPSKSTSSLSTVAGSVGYIPPEYAYTMRVTMAGNVYSFGVILLELLTGRPAVSEGTELAKWVLSNSVQQEKWDRILDFSISRTSLAVRNQMLAILKVALGCVSVSPEARPKMKSVLRMLLNAR